MDALDLDTPALYIDLDAMERNIARMAETFRRAGVNWRPHTKGQKAPASQRLLSYKATPRWETSRPPWTA